MKTRYHCAVINTLLQVGKIIKYGEFNNNALKFFTS